MMISWFRNLQKIIDLLIQLFVIFPYSALTIPRPRIERNISSIGEKDSISNSSGSSSIVNDDDAKEMRDPREPPASASAEISDDLLKLCQGDESITSLLASDPSLTPRDAWKKLFGRRAQHQGERERKRGERRAEAGDDNGSGSYGPGLDRIAACGKWGASKPSELFLKIYGDALQTVDKDLEQAVVSPSLIGSSGTLPLTIISTVPDIVRHMSNLIVRAEREVFLATNYWQHSVSATFITNALRELSHRVGARGLPPLVVKLMYDRGSTKQILESHYEVSEREFTDAQVALPPRSEIPNLDLQVVNYHRPLLGTFHAKFMVVDRRIALIQSNNVQDNTNLEMAVQLEGPIVDSVYDMALISWSRALGNGLPMIKLPARSADHVEMYPSWTENHRRLFEEDGRLKGYPMVVAPGTERGQEIQWLFGSAENGPGRDTTSTINISATSVDSERNGETNGTTDNSNDQDESSGRDGDTDETIPTTDASLEPTASSSTTSAPDPGPHPGTMINGNTAAAAAAAAAAESSGCLQQEHTHKDPHYDIDIPSEVHRIQSSLSPRTTTSNESPLDAVTRHLNHTKNPNYTVPESQKPPPFPPDQAMTPYIPHPVHEPFPMALVNRPPYGTPNNKDVSNPQNAAWLSAMRNAEHSIFIQTPTLNAEPLLPAIVEACERGVHVWCYVCLGYNDSGELLPMQGGHNESIPPKLTTSLSPSALPKLHYSWYVPKDHSTPQVQHSGRRACHIKLLIADARIAVVGSGNQDTQSWFHSQEVNVLLESAPICVAWIAALRRNQNTAEYGALDLKDGGGVWRDAEGKEVEGAMGVDAGRFSWAKGVVGAVKRVQGKGGFG